MSSHLVIRVVLVFTFACAMCLAGGTASAIAAKIVHELEDRFEGDDAPDGPLQFIFGLTVDNSGGENDGEVYVGELGERQAGSQLFSRVLKFDENGSYAGIQIDGTDSPHGSFSFFQNHFPALAADVLAVDNSPGANKGALYIADVGNGVIDRYNEAGEYVCQITGRPTPSSSECAGAAGSTTPDGGLLPTALAVATNGDLYVADVQHRVINRFDESGKYIGQITDPRITQPASIDLDSKGMLYVVNHSFFNGVNAVKFNSSGAFVSVIDSDEPTGVAVDLNTDYVHISHGQGKSISEYDSLGGLAASFGSNPDHNYLTVAISRSSGKVYVGDLNIKSSVDIYSPDIFILEAVTQAPAKVEEATATLSGIVDPASSGEVTSCHFEFGTTTTYGQTASCFPGGPYASLTEVSADLDGLSPSTAYHFRLRIANAEGLEDLGDDEVLHTRGPPTIDEQSASNIERFGAALHAKVNPHGVDTEYKFEYVDAFHYESEGGFDSPATKATLSSELGDGTKSLSVGQAIGGLSPGTTYHFRAVATNSRGTTEGSPQTFTTLPVAAITQQWVYAHLRSATVEAKINPFGFPTACWVEFVRHVDFEASGYAKAESRPCDTSVGSGFSARVVRAELEDLRSGSQYHFRFVAANDSGTVVGGDEEFPTFGIKSFSIEDVDEEGNVLAQAGARPFATITRFEFTHTIVPTSSGTRGSLAAFVKDIITEQSPGRIGYTDNIPRCLGYLVAEERCSGDSQVGQVMVEVFQGEGRGTATRAQYNAFTPEGVASRYASVDPYTFSDARIRTGGDYGTTGGAFNLTEEARIVSVVSTVWGVPADPLHNPQRQCPGIGMRCTSTVSPLPMLRNPTSCTGPRVARTRVSTWQDPAEYVHATTEMPAITGCDKLEFDPSIEWQPTTREADSPTGLHINIHVPQNEDPEGFAVPDLRDVEITPAKGLVFNPAAARGLAACTEGQFNYHGEGPSHCPDDSKIGTVEVNTPQLDHPVHGGIYMATPYENPFDSLFAMYIAIDDPRTGVVVKMAGEIELDPDDGQLTAVFLNNPQLPMEDFRLEFFDGPRAVLRTPTECGIYRTEATLAPWSAPQSGLPEKRTDAYQITSGSNGTPCVSDDAESPHTPTLNAGTLDGTAGAFAPFFVHVSRTDGSQQISGLTVSPPPGLIGRLRGITSCPDAGLAAADAKTGTAEKSSPSCPGESEVGSVSVALGAGSEPLYVPGKVYLSGPYRGAPLSLGIVVSALGGPYDLGTVVVRTALHVDHQSGRLRVETEPLPKILEGVPLDVRSITVKLDRPHFTLNPTNCRQRTLDAGVTSAMGRTALFTVPFRVRGCGKLPFAPRLSLRLLGGLGHGANPSLRAVLRMSPGGANLARTAVVLPPSLFLDNEHIRGICTRPRLEAGSCPESSIYAHAKVWSPLLDKPLQGPVYMRSSNNPLPDLVADLGGQVRFTFEAGVGSQRGGISADMGNLPDVSVRKFVLTMRGGEGGLLQNSIDACSRPQRSFVKFVGQNGKVERQRPLLQARCQAATTRSAARASRRRR